LPKLIFCAFHLLDDMTHLVRLAASWTERSSESEPHEKITRVQFLSQLGAGAAFITFGSMFYGMTRGKFAFRVIEQNVPIAGLPAAFEGARIVHISDMHIGSFLDNYEEVRRAVQMINDLKADYVFFTGDMVNNYAHELDSWIDIIAEIKASRGKFSIFGNHDYGDYVQWPDEQSKRENLQTLVRYHEQMGFRLLRNEHVELRHGDDSITLVGIENWGSGFAKYGDLEKAMRGVDPSAVKVLLSHDPTHWEKQVLGQKPVQLTLSGHTHGMQFGVEIPILNVKISPARMRYKRWGGLYTEGDQHLYVNRGFGFLGFPGRVGIWPEITLLQLTKG
jgi:predicted MPP superfamily phosphohydrolase